jgi:hypothetical protein
MKTVDYTLVAIVKTRGVTIPPFVAMKLPRMHHLGPEHAAVDRKHAAAVLDPGPELAAINCKHAITVLNPGPEHTVINLKFLIVDLATVVP